jgi:hypothetical protein
MLYCPILGIPCAGDHTQTTYNGEVLAVSPDIDKLLEVVTLHETSLDFVCTYPDCNMAKAHHLEYLTGL